VNICFLIYLYQENFQLFPTTLDVVYTVPLVVGVNVLDTVDFVCILTVDALDLRVLLFYFYLDCVRYCHY
jgi:hypothetical protein